LTRTGSLMSRIEWSIMEGRPHGVKILAGFFVFPL
jgi:hypothetical protein